MKGFLKFVALAAITLFVFQCNQASACSCVQFTPCEAFNHATAVFVGTMVSGTENVSEQTKDGKVYSVEAGQVRFSVEESFKGITATAVTISVYSMKGTSCGPYGLIRGERYLVYAWQADASGLTVGPCNPTKQAEYAREDLAFLRNLPEPGIGGRMYGHVGVDFGGRDNPALSGVKIVLSNNQYSYETTTDAKGDYEIRGVAPGKYQIEAQLPKSYSCYSPKREVSIDDRGCATTTYWTKVESSITGVVIDLFGHPAPATLRLISLSNTERRFLGFAHEDGEFEIDGIEPGRYVLAVGIYSAGREQLSKNEELFYFPGTTERDRAKIIEIRMGERLTDYAFMLPEKLRAYSIAGVVQTADGKPAGNTRVVLSITDKTTPKVYRTDDWGSGIDTDEQGHFEFVGFAGNTYSVYARESSAQAYVEKRPPRFSRKVTFKIEREVPEVRLVLNTTEDPDNKPAQKPVGQTKN